MPAGLPAVAGAKMATGSFTGNDTADRQIAHGCGTTPFMIIGIRDDQQAMFCGRDNPGAASHIGDLTNWYACSAWDSTYFRVGNAGSYPNSMNSNGKTYRFVAFYE